ncbi:phage tail assembly chaperone [Conchiformibius kuhniae]|uniref:Phage tail assembly chaperone n=1 Tax=Conchiformibius kuhniae TaxID=211502 RepID=A0A8T9MYS8_9NEIS|nr:phage tail assembly chaperone [Conchiformibius kuhniae]UOP05342.1 phage tail assembly chaperone [Conchiformibius kuhniae]
MAKLKLQPNPTFKVPVDIPVPGQTEAETVVLTCKARTRKELNEFTEKMPEYGSDAAILSDIVTGWDLDVPFNDQNLELLAENYIGSAELIIHAYLREHTKAAQKN